MPSSVSRLWRTVVRAAALAAAAVTFALPGPADAKPYAKRMFDDLCAACHGLSGAGDGPVAGQLKTPPADLSTLTARNGGAFPFERVYQTIDGRNAVAAHGPRDMPVWGRYFSAQDLPPGAYPGMTPEDLAFLRIAGLAYYIQGLQRRDPASD